MAQHFDLEDAYADALAAVLDLDMRAPPAPLPERVTLAPKEVLARGFGADDLIARIRDALPPQP